MILGKHSGVPVPKLAIQMLTEKQKQRQTKVAISNRKCSQQRQLQEEKVGKDRALRKMAIMPRMKYAVQNCLAFILLYIFFHQGKECSQYKIQINIVRENETSLL